MASVCVCVADNSFLSLLSLSLPLSLSLTHSLPPLAAFSEVHVLGGGMEGVGAEWQSGVASCTNVSEK